MLLHSASLILFGLTNLLLSSGFVNRSDCYQKKIFQCGSKSRLFSFSPSPVQSVATDTQNSGASTVAVAAEANQFREELNKVGLSECHGMLHAFGCRQLSDIGKLTPDQITSMGASDFHRSIIDHAMLQTRPFGDSFNFEVVCATNGIFKGRLLTVEQCNELKVMSECHAYQVNPDWIGMACKSIPGYIPATEDIFRRLLNEIHLLYPGSMRKGSVRFESANEPHLVKYNGQQTGAPLHKDSAHKSITINALLSDKNDFGGGGTYIKAIDRTIKLEQGEVLLHPGNLDHAGMDITFGVRQLLVAFLECEWEDECNEPERDYYSPYRKT